MHEVRLRIRWRDIDNYGHVNNAVYLNYLEECRDRMVEDLFGAGEAWDFVLAHVGIDFRSQLTQADGEVVVRCGVVGYGRSSIRTIERVERLRRHARGRGRSRDRAEGAGRGPEPSAHRRRAGCAAGGDRRFR